MIINNSSDDPIDENILVTNYDTMVFNEGTMVVNESDDKGAGKKKLELNLNQLQHCLVTMFIVHCSLFIYFYCRVKLGDDGDQ